MNADDLVPRKHRITYSHEGRSLHFCDAICNKEVSLGPLVECFVQHPAPRPDPDSPPTSAEEQMSEILEYAKLNNWGKVINGIRFVPIAELRAFLFEAVDGHANRELLASFDFGAFAEEIGRQWNVHVTETKEKAQKEFEERKRKLDTLYVQQEVIEPQRAWKRARKDPTL